MVRGRNFTTAAALSSSHSLVGGSAEQKTDRKKNNIPEDNLFSRENLMGEGDAGSNPFPGQGRHPGHIPDLESSRCPPDLVNVSTDKQA